jgi:16S rRNA (uracil1498-N3)-methyltransferase
VSTPRFLVSSEALSGHQVVITGSELHHLRVRRVRLGSSVVLIDGRGQQRDGIVTALGREQVVVSLTPGQPLQRESHLRLVLAQAMLKADKMDLVIEKATELGVAEFLVFASERSLGHPSADRLARWDRIARSAAKQCQRSMLPVFEHPLAFHDVLSRPEELRLLFWEGACTRTLDDQVPASPSSVLAVVGPEGGFSPNEAQQTEAHGFRSISLGPRILRAETAALVAIALCQFRWGDLNRADR